MHVIFSFIVSFFEHRFGIDETSDNHHQKFLSLFLRVFDKIGELADAPLTLLYLNDLLVIIKEK